MLEKTITILPEKKDKIAFNSILNVRNQFGHRICHEKITMPNSDKIFVPFTIFNFTKYKNVTIDYPNLWVQLDILDENMKTVIENYKTIKEDGFIFKKNKINLKKFNFKLILKSNNEELDEALIFVV